MRARAGIPSKVMFPYMQEEVILQIELDIFNNIVYLHGHRHGCNGLTCAMLCSYVRTPAPVHRLCRPHYSHHVTMDQACKCQAAGRGLGAVRLQPIITENTVASKLRGHTCSTAPCHGPCDQGAFIETNRWNNEKSMKTHNTILYCKKKINISKQK